MITELDALRIKVDNIRERLAAVTPGPLTAKHRTPDQDSDLIAKQRNALGGEIGSSVHTGDPSKIIWGSIWPHRNAAADAEFFAHAPRDVSRLLIAVETILGLAHEDYCCLGGGCPGYGLAMCDQATSPGYVCDGYRCTCFLTDPIRAISSALSLYGDQ